MSIGDTCIDFWDFYFVLILMPEVGEWVDVDVKEGTRDYDVIFQMKRHSHLFVSEVDGFVDRIAITPMGIRYLDRMGHLYKGNEEFGKEIIKNLTAEWETMKGRNDKTK